MGSPGAHSLKGRADLVARNACDGSGKLYCDASADFQACADKHLLLVMPSILQPYDLEYVMHPKKSSLYIDKICWGALHAVARAHQQGL
jgi:hypothetical protein